MAWKVKTVAGNGSTHEAELPSDWMPSGDEPPTALEVAAKLVGELARDHRALMGSMAPKFAYKTPLTITIEDA